MVVFAIDSEDSDIDCGGPAESDSVVQAPDAMEASQPTARVGMMPGEFVDGPTDVVLVSSRLGVGCRQPLLAVVRRGRAARRSIAFWGRGGWQLAIGVAGEGHPIAINNHCSQGVRYWIPLVS
eukprot:9921437-Lingulodinium_polyedra.AAC.1